MILVVRELRPDDEIRPGDRLHFAAGTEAEAEALRRRHEALCAGGRPFPASALLEPEK